MPNSQHALSRTDTDEFMLSDQALSAILPVANRLGLAHAAMVKRLVAVLADQVALKVAGASEVEGGAIPNAILSLHDTLYGGAAMTCERTIMRMELDADVAEDHVEGVVAIEGENPTLLEMHADALDKQAAASRARARMLRRKARQIRTNRIVARHRIGAA